MKKKMFVALFATAVVLSMSAGALAASHLQEIKAYLNTSLTVLVNGEELEIRDSTGKVTSPITYNGTTFLPVRSIGEAFGYTVGFNAGENAVTLDGGLASQREIMGKVAIFGGANLWYTLDEEDELLYAGIDIHATEWEEVNPADLVFLFAILMDTEADVFQVNYVEDGEVIGSAAADRETLAELDELSLDMDFEQWEQEFVSRLTLSGVFAEE